MTFPWVPSIQFQAASKTFNRKMLKQTIKILPESRLSRGLLLVLYLIPPVALLWLILNLGVNIPYRDQWNLVALFEKIYDGNAQFSDFFAQHSEHRIVFPKILFSALAFTTKWNVGYELGLNFFFGLVIFLALFSISLKTAHSMAVHSSRLPRPALFHAVNLLSCCLVFSWVQCQNWLWGFQVPWFFISACLALALLVLVQENITPKKRLIAGAIICFVASFCSAHGLFIWIAIIPALVAIPGNLKTVSSRLAIWVLLFLICLKIYLAGYFTPALQTPEGRGYLVDYIGYFFVQIGTPFLGSNTNVWLTMAAGGLIFFLFFSIAIYGLVKLPTNFFLLASPWLSVGLYATTFALANSYGRYRYGLELAREGRYTTANILMMIAVLQLLPVFFNFSSIRVNRKLLSVLAAAFLVIHLSTYAFAFQDAKYGERGTLLRNTQILCMDLIEYIEDKAFPQCFVDEDATKAHVLVLNRIGLRQPVEEIAFTGNLVLPTPLMADKNSAHVSATVVEGNIEITGHVVIPKNQLPNQMDQRPRAALIALEDQKTFVAVADLKPFPISNTGEIQWRVRLTPEDSLPLVQKAQILKIYLYYPTQKQFVLATQLPLGSVLSELASQ